MAVLGHMLGAQVCNWHVKWGQSVALVLNLRHLVLPEGSWSKQLAELCYSQRLGGELLDVQYLHSNFRREVLWERSQRGIAGCCFLVGRSESGTWAMAVVRGSGL